jgi:hypothetical protein
MNKSSHHDLPDENKIEELLERYKPHPSEQFHKRMKSAPWRNREVTRKFILFNHKKITPRLVWAFCILFVCVLIGSVFLIPPVRAVARQIIFSFISAPSNQIVVQVTPVRPNELFNFSDPANYQLSLDDAQQQAGFPIMQISPITEKLKLIGTRYEPNYRSVIMLYQGENYDLFLTQRSLGNGQDVFSIGQDALVKLVKIGNLQGEYVEGGWKAISLQPTSDHQTPQNPINITAVWDDSLPQSTLRWQVDQMAYELRAIGEQRPSLTDLLNWANELK